MFGYQQQPQQYQYGVGVYSKQPPQPVLPLPQLQQVPYDPNWAMFESYMRSDPLLSYNTLNDQQKFSLYLSWQRYLEIIRGSPIVNSPQTVIAYFLQYLSLNPPQMPQQQHTALSTFFGQPQQQSQPASIGIGIGSVSQSPQPVLQSPQSVLPPNPNYQQFPLNQAQGNIPNFVVNQPPPPPPTNQSKNDQEWDSAVREQGIYFESRQGRITQENVLKMIDTATRLKKVVTDSHLLYSANYVQCNNPPFQVISFIVFEFKFDYANLGWKFVKKNTKHHQTPSTQT